MRNPRDLCRREDAKALLPAYEEPADPTEQAAADALWDRLIASASQRIYEVAGREFLADNDPGENGGGAFPDPPEQERLFDVAELVQTPRRPDAVRARRWLKVGDLASFSALGYSWPYSTQPTTPLVLADATGFPRRRKPWQPIRWVEHRHGWPEGAVASVTGRWGFPELPPDIRQACAEQAAVWASRDLSKFGQFFQDAVAQGSRPSEPRSLAQSVYDTALLYRVPEV